MTRLARKLRDERGATFSVALLLMLVCVAASSILLAASSASAGQFAGQAKMDRNYYSVTSAAKLFTSSLDGGAPAGVSGAGDGTRTYTLVQEQVGSRTVTHPRVGGSVESAVTLVDGETEATFNAPSTSTGFDFLCDLTCYALSGSGRAAASDAVLTGMLKDDGWNSWIEPFGEGAWASASEDHTTGLKVSPDIGYDLAPALVGSSADAEDIAVEAEARLRSDWTLEVAFSNKADDPDEKYSLYMLLSAQVDTSDSTSEETTGTSVDSGTGATIVAQTLKSTKTVTVKWAIDQVVPGRGLSHA